MFKLTEVLVFVQIALIIAKLAGGLDEAHWGAIFFPAYMMIIWEYVKMFSKKLPKTQHKERSAQKIKLPTKNNNGDLFYMLIDPILEKHGLLQDYSIVFFNEVFGRPELFEYVGDIDIVTRLAQDQKTIQYLCDQRRHFFAELVADQGASINTMIGVLLDNRNNPLGLIAFWNNSTTMLTVGEGMRIEFTTLPIGVIID